MKNLSLGLATLLAPALFACGSSGVPTGLEAAAPAPVLPAASAPVILDQGWTDAELATWMNTSTGSRLLPWAWAQALEQPGSTGLFFDPAYLYDVYKLPLRTLPDGLVLPRGFALNAADDTDYGITQQRWKQGQSSTEPWLGVNCSGCHSADIRYNGKAMTVNGGATLADTFLFFKTMTEALEATRDDAAKFDRFARRALGEADSAGNRTMLRASMQAIIEDRMRPLFELSKNDVAGGPGRIDATGLVLNAWQRVLHSKETTHNPTDAPTSFPALWNVPQMDHLQSSGFAPSLNLIDSNGYRFNPLFFAGDIGVVMGDFGDVVSTPFPASLSGFKSSIDFESLLSFGDLLNRLKSPAWPSDLLGTPDAALVAQGETLFDSKGCSGCHMELGRDDLETPVLTTLVPLKGENAIGTDPWMACNTYQYTMQTGDLQGMPILPEGTPSGGGIIGNRNKVADVQATAVIFIMLGQADKFLSGALNSYASGLQQTGFLPLPGESTLQLLNRLTVPGRAVTDEPQPPADKKARGQACLATDHKWLAYRARPLNGIWSTAPYLHSGSVPTLYDVLLPEAQRPKTFWTGTEQFDPARVGYLTGQSAPGNSFLMDTGIDGNRNTGHNFPKEGLSDAERKALVEYLKTL
ncbi:MAG: di-heme-cytochrome C peroxidase [Stagnimonas sp.]|nr:di-heme-cytochrome C peroxidase [Stagnimonas sp.]